MTATAVGHAPAARRHRAGASAGPASRSASSRSSSPCRRCSCARGVPVVILGAARRSPAARYAIGAGERRLGWGAIVAGCVGIAGGYAATQSGETNLKSVVVWGALLAATLRYATPLTFGALGGLFSERSGVINIALEGMMLIGAFFGAWGADITGLVDRRASSSRWSRARSSALIHALFAVTLRADQIVSGTALNLLAVGITGYLYVDIYGDDGHARQPAGRARRAPADRARCRCSATSSASSTCSSGSRWRSCSSPGSWSSARRPACGCARRARTRWRPRPPACRSCARATWP